MRQHFSTAVNGVWEVTNTGPIGGQEIPEQDTQPPSKVLERQQLSNLVSGSLYAPKKIKDPKELVFMWNILVFPKFKLRKIFRYLWMLSGTMPNLAKVVNIKTGCNKEPETWPMALPTSYTHWLVLHSECISDLCMCWSGRHISLGHAEDTHLSTLNSSNVFSYWEAIKLTMTDTIFSNF